MGIEFVRSRSKAHRRAQTREFILAAGDLIVQASLPTLSEIVFRASVFRKKERLHPETQLLMRASSDRIDCYFEGEKVAIVERPSAKWYQRVSELPEGFCVGTVEERHIDADQLSIRVSM